MGWERRGDGWYYYRKVRRGRKVVSGYVGREADFFTHVRALLGEEDRRSRAEARDARRRAADAERAVLDAEAAGHRAWYALVESIVRAALEAAGYHRHARGAWRKRRRMSNPDPSGLPAVPTGPPPDADLAPMLADVRRGLVMASERIVAAQFHGHDEAQKRAVLDQMGRLRAELAGPAPTPLEGLLVDRVVMCWLQVQSFEGVAAQVKRTPDASLRMERRRDQAHRRYLQAIKTLAQVRRLELPAMQVNVAMAGGRQVNVGGA